MAWVFNPFTGTLDATGAVSIPRAGTFASLADQSIVDPVNAQVVTYDTTIASTGVSIVDSSKIVLPAIGNYLFSISAVITNAAGGDQAASIWLRKNGADVAASNTYLTVPKANNMIIAVVLDVPCTTVGDYYEVWWSGQNVLVRLDGVPAVTGSSTFPPNQPASPAIIVTVAQVG